MTSISSSVLVSGLTRAVTPVAPRVAEPATAVPTVRAFVTELVAAAKQELQADAGATQSAKSAASESNKKVMSKEELTKQVQALQAKMDKLNPALAFVLDPDSGRELIQLTDRQTKEVILQYPTQATLQISKALDQFQKGQLVSKLA